MKRFSVYFFGDSVFFGQCVSLHKNWVTRVSARLDEALAARGHTSLVQNCSVSGNTTTMALNRMAYDIQGKDIDILVVQFGPNDANIWRTDNGLPRVGEAACEANLQEIVDRAHNFNIPSVMLCTFHPTGRTANLPNSDIPYDDNIMRYNEIVRTVARANQPYVTLVDVETAVREALPAENPLIHVRPAPDVIHLSEWGNDFYTQIFFDALKKRADELIAYR